MATLQSKPTASGQTPREVKTIASDVFNEREAADYLHIKIRTCRDWRARRGLPAFKPTAKVTLFRKVDLDDWLSKFRVAAIPRRARRAAHVSRSARPSCKAGTRQGGAQ